MDILGLGSENLIKIKKDKNFKIQVNELEKQINLDTKSGFKPIGVIGIAGTTNTGSVDPMDKILKICKKFDLPIVAVGMGEKETDLHPFKAEYFAKALLGFET